MPMQPQSNILEYKEQTEETSYDINESYSFNISILVIKE